MKIKLCLLFFAISILASGQSWKSYMQIPNKNTRFGASIPVNGIVFEIDSSAFYQVTKLMAATDSMKTVFRGRYYVKLTGSTGGGTSTNYWTLAGQLLSNADTTASTTIHSNAGNKRAYLDLFTASGSWYLGGYRYATGTEARISGINGVVSMSGNGLGHNDYISLNGGGYLKGYSGSGKLKIGTASDPWGNIYSDTVFSGAYNSANWNTAYGWGNHANSGYIVDPGDQLGDMVYRKSTGGYESIPIGDNGNVLKVYMGVPAWGSDNSLQKIDSTKTPFYYSGGKILPRLSSANLGIGSAISPLHKLVVVSDRTTPYVFNFTDTYNKKRTTIAEATDSSSFSGNVTGTGKYQVKLVSQGSTLWNLDTVQTTIFGGNQAGSTLNLNSTTGAGTSSGIGIRFGVGTAGATKAITVLNDGKVGIGKTNPAAKLDVVGDIYFSGAIVGGDFTSGGGNHVLFSYGDIYLETDNTIRATVKATTGNVGVGTTSPATKFHVKDGAIRAGVVAYTEVDSTTVKAKSFTVTTTDTTSVGYSVGAIQMRITASDTSAWMLIRTTGSKAARWKKLSN